MDLRFIWEAIIVLFTVFCLLRITGKKTVGKMSGLEVIALLATASMIGHAVVGKGLWKTIATLGIFAVFVVTAQFLAIKFDWLEKWFMGKASLVIKDGKVLPENLKKLRMSVDQLEAMLREKGISSFTDVKTATVEMSGELGYELQRHAKPLTIGEWEKIAALLLTKESVKEQAPKPNLFQEVIYKEHDTQIPRDLD